MSLFQAVPTSTWRLFFSFNKLLIRLHRFLSYIPKHDLIQQSYEGNNVSFVSKMFLQWTSKHLCFPSCRLVVFRAISSNTLFTWVTGRSHACCEERREKCPRIFSNYQVRFFHESKRKVMDCSMLFCLFLGSWKWLARGGGGGGGCSRTIQCRGYAPNMFLEVSPM